MAMMELQSADTMFGPQGLKALSTISKCILMSFDDPFPSPHKLDLHSEYSHTHNVTMPPKKKLRRDISGLKNQPKLTTDSSHTNEPRFINRSWRWMSAYRMRLTGNAAQWAVRKQKGHAVYRELQ
jgi:hypothetical protein